MSEVVNNFQVFMQKHGNTANQLDNRATQHHAPNSIKKNSSGLMFKKENIYIFF